MNNIIKIPSAQSYRLQIPAPQIQRLWNKLLCTSAFLAATSFLCANTYHVNVATGNDSNDGSESTPFQTLDHARAVAKGGDEVILYDGNYGAFAISTSVDIYDDWVTFRAAEGTSPQLDQFRITGSTGPNHTGAYNAYIKLSDIHILGAADVDNAVDLRGPRHVIIDNCLIEQDGPLTGTTAIMDNKSAVYMRGFENVTISNCEITRAVTAITARGHEAKILHNHIHDITHDGIRSLGLWNSLVEGNRIHGLDDGVEDTDGVDYNRHCDAIHIFIMGGPLESLQPNQNVTFRGNIMYDIESQSVQFNNYGPQPSVRNNHITFENNIFGPVGAFNVFNNAEPVDTLIFRNNSVVRINGGSSYTSPYTLTGRTIILNNYEVAFSSKTTDLQVYNNIMSNQWGWPVSTATIFDYNIIQYANMGAPTGGPNTIFTNDQQYKNPELLDGVLLDNSLAIDAGSPTAYVYGLDAHNQIRDSMPDIGAYEFGGVFNTQPVLAYIASQSIFEGNTLSLVVSANDADNNPITLSAEGLPSFGNFTDNGNGTAFITFSSDSTPGTYTIVVTASDGVVSDSKTFTLTVEALSVSNSVLKGHWTFDNNANDSSGLSHNGTLQGGASYVMDPAPEPQEANNTHALLTGGSGLQFSVPDSEELRITSDLTLAVYIKPNAGSAGNIISKSTNDGYRLVINNSFQPRLLLGIPGSGPHTVRSLIANLVLTPDEWQHLAVTVKFDNGTATVKFFHNNELASTHTTTLDGIENGTGILAVGTNSEGQEAYTGAIDDLRIYSGALTDAEIKFMYGGITDPEVNWGGYPIIDDYVNTGEWIGWLYLYPNTNWLYSYSLNNHLYFPSPSASGGWAFIRK